MVSVNAVPWIHDMQSYANAQFTNRPFMNLTGWTFWLFLKYLFIEGFCRCLVWMKRKMTEKVAEPPHQNIPQRQHNQWLQINNEKIFLKEKSKEEKEGSQRCSYFRLKQADWYESLLVPYVTCLAQLLQPQSVSPHLLLSSTFFSFTLNLFVRYLYWLLSRSDLHLKQRAETLSGSLGAALLRLAFFMSCFVVFLEKSSRRAPLIHFVF